MAKRSLWSVVQPPAALAAAALFIGVPGWLVVVSSGETTAESQIPSLRLPRSWHFLQNYREVLTTGQMLRGLVNSLVIVPPAVLITVALAGMASWVLARRPSRAASLLYSLGISGMILPASVITMVWELRRLGLQDTRPGLVVCYIGMFTSIAIFFMTGFIRTVPIELEEAARLDGATSLRIYFRIILPMLRPVLVTSVVMIMLLAWNDLFYAFFILGNGQQTLPLNLYQVAVTDLYVNNWNYIFAFIVLMSLPLILVFLVAQRRIVSGITKGAVK